MVKKKSPYELDFEEYIRNSEPAKKEKTYAWTTAIGLDPAIPLFIFLSTFE